MAAKIKIDLDPEGPITFDREVSIPTPSGKPLKVTFTFRHRTREEMAEMTERYTEKARAQYVEVQDEIRREKAAREEAEARGETYLPPPRKLVEGVAEALRSDVEAVMDAATGWNLHQEFNEENLTKFFRLYSQAAVTIATDYRVSMNEGRLGN